MDDYERFMTHVDTIGGPDACHPWTGSRFCRGYGKFWAEGRSRRAARWLVGFLRGRPLDPDEWALHRCDNPPCCNPAHLYVGTDEQNIHDRSTRGRSSRQGSPLSAANAAVTHCLNGHEFSRRVNGTGQRRCRVCELAAERRYRARRRELVG